MFFGIHRHKRAKLLQAWIDHAARAGIFEPHPLQHGLFQLAHGDAIAKIGDIRWRGFWVDWPPNQGQ